MIFNGYRVACNRKEDGNKVAVLIQSRQSPVLAKPPLSEKGYYFFRTTAMPPQGTSTWIVGLN